MTEDEARALLKKVYTSLKTRREGHGIDDGINAAIDDVGGLDTREKAVIICSALSGILDDLDCSEIHPYSQAGYDLQEAMSSFVLEGISQTLNSIGKDYLDDDVLALEWTSPFDECE